MATGKFPGKIVYHFWRVCWGDNTGRLTHLFAHSYRLILVDEFTKIVPSSFRPFIGHHQELFACVKSVFVYQFQAKTKTFIRKLEKILINLHRQNVSLLFNQTCLNERPLPNHTHTHTHTHTHIYIYIYIYACVCVCARSWSLLIYYSIYIYIYIYEQLIFAYLLFCLMTTYTYNQYHTLVNQRQRWRAPLHDQEYEQCYTSTHYFWKF